MKDLPPRKLTMKLTRLSRLRLDGGLSRLRLDGALPLPWHLAAISLTASTMAMACRCRAGV